MTDQETIQKLKDYTGDNAFLKSVLNGYNRWGRLTPRQMEAVKKFFTPKKPKGSIKPIKLNVDLVLKKGRLSHTNVIFVLQVLYL